MRRFHAQNLNEKPNGKTGSMLRHGRCWLRLGGQSDERPHGSVGPTLRAEWSVPSGRFRLGLKFGGYGDEDLQLSVGVGLFSLWLSVEDLPRWLKERLPKGRECEVYWYEKALWIKPWARFDSWVRSDPWWMRGVTIHFDDLLLGKSKYTDETISEKEVLVPMPEGSYPAKVRMFLSTWSRPRWFAKRLVRADIEIPGGIPIMGKGENSWDCGEDAIYSMTMPADDAEDAVGKMVTSVLERRRKYGGPRGLEAVLSPRVKKEAGG